MESLGHGSQTDESTPSSLTMTLLQRVPETGTASRYNLRGSDSCEISHQDCATASGCIQSLHLAAGDSSLQTASRHSSCAGSHHGPPLELSASPSFHRAKQKPDVEQWSDAECGDVHVVVQRPAHKMLSLEIFEEPMGTVTEEGPQTADSASGGNNADDCVWGQRLPAQVSPDSAHSPVIQPQPSSSTPHELCSDGGAGDASIEPPSSSSSTFVMQAATEPPSASVTEGGGAAGEERALSSAGGSSVQYCSTASISLVGSLHSGVLGLAGSGLFIHRNTTSSGGASRINSTGSFGIRPRSSFGGFRNHVFIRHRSTSGGSGLHAMVRQGSRLQHEGSGTHRRRSHNHLPSYSGSSITVHSKHASSGGGSLGSTGSHWSRIPPSLPEEQAISDTAPPSSEQAAHASLPVALLAAAKMFSKNPFGSLIVPASAAPELSESPRIRDATCRSPRSNKVPVASLMTASFAIYASAASTILSKPGAAAGTEGDDYAISDKSPAAGTGSDIVLDPGTGKGSHASVTPAWQDRGSQHQLAQHSSPPTHLLTSNSCHTAATGNGRMPTPSAHAHRLQSVASSPAGSPQTIQGTLSSLPLLTGAASAAATSHARIGSPCITPTGSFTPRRGLLPSLEGIASSLLASSSDEEGDGAGCASGRWAPDPLATNSSFGPSLTSSRPASNVGSLHNPPPAFCTTPLSHTGDLPNPFLSPNSALNALTNNTPMMGPSRAWQPHPAFGPLVGPAHSYSKPNRRTSNSSHVRGHAPGSLPTQIRPATQPNTLAEAAIAAGIKPASAGAVFNDSIPPHIPQMYATFAHGTRNSAPPGSKLTPHNLNLLHQHLSGAQGGVPGVHSTGLHAAQGAHLVRQSSMPSNIVMGLPTSMGGSSASVPALNWVHGPNGRRTTATVTGGSNLAAGTAPASRRVTHTPCSDTEVFQLNINNPLSQLPMLDCGRHQVTTFKYCPASQPLSAIPSAPGAASHPDAPTPEHTPQPQPVNNPDACPVCPADTSHLEKEPPERESVLSVRTRQPATQLASDSSHPSAHVPHHAGTAPTSPAASHHHHTPMLGGSTPNTPRSMQPDGADAAAEAGVTPGSKSGLLQRVLQSTKKALRKLHSNNSSPMGSPSKQAGRQCSPAMRNQEEQWLVSAAFRQGLALPEPITQQPHHQTLAIQPIVVVDSEEVGVKRQGSSCLVSPTEEAPPGPNNFLTMLKPPTPAPNYCESSMLPDQAEDVGPWPDVDFIDRLGKGSYGDVFKGVWNDTLVAVKVTRWPQLTGPGATTPASVFSPYSTGHGRGSNAVYSRAASGINTLRPTLSATMLAELSSQGEAAADGGAVGPTRPLRPSTSEVALWGATAQLTSAGGACTPAPAAAEGEGVDEEGAQVLARCEWESWVGSKLRHPNIATTYTSFTVGLVGERRTGVGMFGRGRQNFGRSWVNYLVMELCDAGTLESAIRRGMFKVSSHNAVVEQQPWHPATPVPNAAEGCTHLGSRQGVDNFGVRGGGAGSRVDMVLVLHAIKELAAALACMHSLGVVHGDVKPSNCLLKPKAVTPDDNRGWELKLADFGVARVVDQAQALQQCRSDQYCTSPTAAGQQNQHPPRASSVCVGALSHAAPEVVVDGGSCGFAADVWSLGVVLWELCSGEQPYAAWPPSQLLQTKLQAAQSVNGTQGQGQDSLPSFCQAPQAEGRVGAEGEDPAGAHHALMLPFPEGMDPQIEGLCRRCWALQPCHRPTMPQFMTSLRAIGAAQLGQGAALLFPGLRYLQSKGDA